MNGYLNPAMPKASFSATKMRHFPQSNKKLPDSQQVTFK